MSFVKILLSFPDSSQTTTDLLGVDATNNVYSKMVFVISSKKCSRRTIGLCQSFDQPDSSYRYCDVLQPCG
jgi:hypothetical protein